MFRSLIEQSRAVAKPFTPPTLMPTSPPDLQRVPTAPVDTSHLVVQPEQGAIEPVPQQAPMTAADRIRAFRDAAELPGLKAPQPEQRQGRQYIDATAPRYLR